MLVRDVMSESPYAVQMSTPVKEVMRQLYEADVRHLPVLDGKTLVGIISDRDLRGLSPPALLQLSRPEELEGILDQPISRLMSTDVLSVTPEDEIAEAVDQMIEQKIGALPVVQAGSPQLLGIVSYIDVLRSARDLL